VFDEVYYVNAARIIDGFTVTDDQHYGGAPSGKDPNAEHPQLGKVLIAASMRVLGDDPLGWRLPSLIFGTLCVIGMYVLARVSGATRWLALGATAMLAFDNLFIVHGRIGTLDVFALAFMIWAAVAYMRGLHLTSGVLVGIGSCMKLVAPYMLFVFLLVEILRRIATWRTHDEDAPSWFRQFRNFFSSGLAAAAVYFVALSVLDALVPAYDASTATTYTNAVSHTAHMINYAVGLTAHAPQGIASYGWQWLYDFKPISYLGLDTPVHAFGNTFQVATTHFLGFVNPLIILLIVPGFIYCFIDFLRRGKGVEGIALAWFIGTYVPLLLASMIWHRISYLYYMLAVLPGVCLLGSTLLASRRLWRWVKTVWVIFFIAAAVLLYPFTPFLDPNWA
jgi:predicted membrane-bound dolichyl-phosphate-mannose-protein mannosyltransferase